ncbi:MAG: NAD(P)H-dependent glycerol-3-phosphate dehydrogenase [Spirochaetia bacterium]
MAKHTIGVIGAGAWGTAVAKIIAEKEYEVEIWSFEADVADTINKDHENKKYLPNVELPDNIKANTEIREVAAGKDYLLFVPPSLFILNTLKQILDVEDVKNGETPIGVLTKGFIEGKTGPKLIVETMENYLPGFYKNNLVYISGPSHAEEVARGKLTGLISASSNGRNSILFRELLKTSSVMVFASIDIIGVQTCAAMKNVIAIAFGILDALKEISEGFGDNTESLLLAAGLNEIMRLGTALGATHPETFTSIAGVGDLDVTCRSIHGRNRRFGRDIVHKKVIQKYTDLNEVIANINEIGYLPEGSVACKYAIQLAEKHNLRLPITEAVFKILNREKEPLETVQYLMTHLNRDSVRGIVEQQRLH